jgi:hypothetical protein
MKIKMPPKSFFVHDVHMKAVIAIGWVYDTGFVAKRHPAPSLWLPSGITNHNKTRGLPLYASGDLPVCILAKYARLFI